MDAPQLWLDLARAANIELTPAQIAQLNGYLDRLIEINQVMNLTRITDRPEAERLHVGDALTLLPHLPAGPIRIADVGSGGGVPGLVLAIARPDATVMLIESTQKKATFLKETAATLKLGNVLVSSWRAEDVAHSNSRETFDVVTARAVGALDRLVEWCLPLVEVRGKMLAMKGERVTAELPNATRIIRLLGGGVPIVHPVVLPEAEHHVIVEVEKIARTEKHFPRSATVAKGKAIP